MKRYLILLLLPLLTTNCSKDSSDIIPNVRFTAEINLDNPQYSGKNPFFVLPGGTNRYVGVNGVVVFEVTPTEFYAFDLMCTHQHDNGNRFYVEEINQGDVVLRCPECGSEFNIAAEYGSVVTGPAKWPLKRYQTSVTGNILRIWN